MKALVETIAKKLVNNPDDVSVEKTEQGDSDLYELTVNPDDLGQVIGRQGRTARAVRTLVRAASAKIDRGAQVEIVE